MNIGNPHVAVDSMPVLRDSPADPEIQVALASLRRRIRVYVVCQGALLAAIWLVSSFWVAFALDYLPVLIGLDEMSALARGIVLVLIVSMTLWITFRWIVRRVLARLDDPSLALVLERRFPEFSDALATAVGELTGSASSEQSKLYQRTVELARQRLRSVELSRVFNYRPAIASGLLVAVLGLSVVAFAAVNPRGFSMSMQRLYLLSHQPWPRHCRLEMVGLRVKQAEVLENVTGVDGDVRFYDGVATVGKASSVSLLVRAAAPTSNDPDRVVPRACQFIYRTAEGTRGSLPMTKVGGGAGGYQLFSVDGKILDGLLTGLEFHVRGGDHRIGPYRIKAEPNPIIVETQLDCRYPPYIKREQTSRWTDRMISWSAGTKMPFGTQVTVFGRSNRALKKVYVLDADGQLTETLSVSPDAPFEFRYTPPRVEEDLHIGFLLHDQDDLISPEVRRVTIGAIHDQPPQVDSLLPGIGSAVTANVRIPITGKIQDDYATNQVWVEMEMPANERLVVECRHLADMQVEGEVDFRRLRREQADLGSSLPEDGSQISLVLKASDFNDLKPEDQIGVGDRYVLDVVSPNRMLRILERLEAGQRRRLEQIHAEMLESRQYLARVVSRQGDPDSGFEPGDKQEADDAESFREANDLPNETEMKRLFNQRALLQTQKSTQEVAGVASAFEDIRLQLINNRVDSQDRKNRLQQLIVAPLQAISSETMATLEVKLKELEATFRALEEGDDQLSETDVMRLAGESIRQTDLVLSQIQGVLDLLIRIETQNELLDIVRQMIVTQELLIERTKAERNRQVFEGLLK